MFPFFFCSLVFLLRLFLAPHHHRCNNGDPATKETCPSNNAPMCHSCLTSFTLSSDSTRCDPCAFGKFGASPGVCTNCTAGRYEDSIGSLACKECARGQSQEQGGMTACSPCDVGTFANVTLLEQCYDCPKGYYVEYPGSASCFSCSPGKFAPVKRSLKCNDCPSGRLQRLAEQPSCYSVEAGQVVAEGGSASIRVPLGSKICGENSGCTDEKAPFEACMPGTYGKEPPTTLCYDCEAGESSSQGATKCRAWYQHIFSFFFISSCS